MATSHFIIVTIWTLYVHIALTADDCNQWNQRCDDGRYCTAQTAKMIYPDPATFFSTDAIAKTPAYGCNSKAYCEWASLWGKKCIRFSIPKMFDAPFYTEATDDCSVITVPITINETISCCQPDLFDCDEVFEGINRKESSIYATSNCEEDPVVGSITEDIVDCYTTLEFMKYIKCNIKEYVGKCPNFFFTNLETYAKCACVQLGARNDTSYLYFKEMTAMIEGAFKSFRGKDSEVCPEWKFSCNQKGEAQLDVFEIICPLIMYEDTNATKLKQEVDAGVKSQANTQVEIFGDVIRVLMYSEEQAIDALDWLVLNQTDETPDEIGAPCDMEETVWNLNELYGDYIPPPTTPAPTDDAYTFGMSSFVSIVLVMFCCFFV